MMRTVLLDGQPPVLTTLRNLLIVSTVTFAVGLLVFRKLKNGFYEYL
jgi:ABC-type polysaccharide/polyol phosphate export permease